MITALLQKHMRRLRATLTRRYYLLSMFLKGYLRLGTRYGGWWVRYGIYKQPPLLIDCGLGLDISFPVTFINKYNARVIGIEPNPKSLEYCKQNAPSAIEVIPKAFWSTDTETLEFHLPRNKEQLPKGADAVSGSVYGHHNYAGGGVLKVETIDLESILKLAGRNTCDVLKMDVEGAEYEILPSLCKSGQIKKAGQLLVEFHHFCTDYTIEDTEKVVAQIVDSGFKLVHTEGRNYVFMNRNFET